MFGIKTITTSSSHNKFSDSHLLNSKDDDRMNNSRTFNRTSLFSAVHIVTCSNTHCPADGSIVLAVTFINHFTSLRLRVLNSSPWLQFLLDEKTVAMA